MFIETPLPFVKAFIEDLNDALKEYKSGSGLTLIQKTWLSFCIMGILVTNSVCWARFERASVGKYSLAALSWMFRKSKIPWELLLHMSVRIILQDYGITEGIVVEDDSDKKRSKGTKRIFRVHKLKDKASGGYIMGQSVVFVVLVTSVVTLPVGFAFYMPDPAFTEWYNGEKKLKKQGVAKKERPYKPARNAHYPTKQEIGLSLLKEFTHSLYCESEAYCSGCLVWHV